MRFGKFAVGHTFRAQPATHAPSVDATHAPSVDQEFGAMLAIAGSSFAGVIACSALLYLLF